ncbi:MAG: hypothetical protein Q8Q32_01195 [bacterium]|nr:hypothetical protein [bacterium]
MKKIITIILVVLIIAALIWNVWIIFFREKSPAQTPETVLLNEEASPLETGQQRLRRIQNTTRSAIEKLSNSELLTVNAGGKVNIINPGEGTERELTQLPEILALINLQAISEERILLQTQTDSGTGFYILLNASNSWLRLPSTVSTASLNPSGDLVAVFNENSGQLEIFDYNSQETLQTFALNLYDVVLSWPNENTILLQSDPSRESEGFLLSFDLENETLGLLQERIGLRALISDDLSVTLSLESGPVSEAKLSIVKDLQTFPLSFTTIPDKCSFASSDILYCAIPEQQNETVDYPDSYLQGAAYSQDNFIQLNTNSLSSKTVLSSAQHDLNLDAKDLEILGEKIYFINRYDNQLYELSLEE